MFLKRLLATTAIAALTGLPVLAAEVTVMSWGGAYGAAQTEAHVKPYAAKTGATVKMVDSDNPATPIKAMVEAKNVTVDVASVEYADAIRLCDEGLLEPIDIASLPPGSDGVAAAEDFLAGAVTECGVSTDIWATVYAYDTTKFGGGLGALNLETSVPSAVRAALQASFPEADVDKLSLAELYGFAEAYSKMMPATVPTTAADFFDLAKFPGKRGIRKGAKAVLEFALMADGVPPGEVYALLKTPEGIDRAFKKLDTIKGSVVWWESGSQPPQLLADGEVVMTTAYNGRIFNAAIGEGKPFQIVWDGQSYENEMYVVPKGSPNKDAALDFIKFATSTEGLRAQATYISYGPARKSSLKEELIFKDGKTVMAPHLPTAPANLTNALESNFEFWVERDSELNERFAAWLAKG